MKVEKMMLTSVADSIEELQEFVEVNALDKTSKNYFFIVVWEEEG